MWAPIEVKIHRHLRTMPLVTFGNRNYFNMQIKDFKYYFLKQRQGDVLQKIC